MTLAVRGLVLLLGLLGDSHVFANQSYTAVQAECHVVPI